MCSLISLIILAACCIGDKKQMNVCMCRQMGGYGLEQKSNFFRYMQEMARRKIQICGRMVHIICCKT